jgi:CheY-like chemotaxis protein
MTETGPLREILLVDDDSLDAAILRRVLRELAVVNRLAHTMDGSQALTHLKGQSGALPCVILLDLNMPRMNGFEFLQAVKGDEVLQDIPVVVVTTSEDPQDITHSLELGAAAYVVKSLSYGEFRQSMGVIRPYLAPAPRPATAPA